MSYELRLEKADIQIILGALAELPIKVAGNTFAKVQHLAQQQEAAMQMIAQNAAPNAPAAEKQQ